MKIGRAVRVGLTFEFGRYPQGRLNKKAVRRFNKKKCSLEEAFNDFSERPIRWVIAEADIEKRQALLICRKGIDAGCYNKSLPNSHWEKSDLRSWLNTEFIERAFTEEERSRIVSADICCDAQDSCRTVQDKVFILSAAEAYKYLPSVQERRCLITPYAAAKGAYCSDQGECCWWLRTPAEDESCCRFVSYGGSCTYSIKADFTANCIRPALWVKY